VHMSLVIKEHSVIQRFKHTDTIKLHNGESSISTFKWLPHMPLFM